MADKVTINLQATQIQPQQTIASSVRRPGFLTSRSAQFVVLARDGSPSMSGQKATDATAASVDLVAELAKPENKDGFVVAVVDFSDAPTVVNPSAKAGDLIGRIAPIDTDNGSGTNIADTLGRCHELIRERDRHLHVDRGRIELKPVVLLFSDGQPNEGGDPRPAATGLKAVADLVTVAFGSDADEAMLRDLATTPQHAYRCRNGRELRQFLASVGKTLTMTMSQGRNATVALTQMGGRQ